MQTYEQPSKLDADGKFEPPPQFDPPATRPGWAGFAIILGILALPFIASNLIDIV
ncbi:MAG TPA: hypothetical protein VFS04_13725 [Alphaproteobacteria bacterium]|nr:hypothetical protein [Alphaproteobacteria bacterium]